MTLWACNGCRTSDLLTSVDTTPDGRITSIPGYENAIIGLETMDSFIPNIA
jgi:hypothetical protein